MEIEVAEYRAKNETYTRIIETWFAFDSCETLQRGYQTECIYSGGAKKPIYYRYRDISGIPGENPAIDQATITTVHPWGEWQKTL